MILFTILHVKNIPALMAEALFSSPRQDIRLRKSNSSQSNYPPPLADSKRDSQWSYADVIRKAVPNSSFVANRFSPLYKILFNWKFLKKRLCFRCGDSRHLAKDCRNLIRCFNCGGLGHRKSGCSEIHKGNLDYELMHINCLKFCQRLISFLNLYEMISSNQKDDGAYMLLLMGWHMEGLVDGVLWRKKVQYASRSNRGPPLPRPLGRKEHALSFCINYLKLWRIFSDSVSKNKRRGFRLLNEILFHFDIINSRVNCDRGNDDSQVNLKDVEGIDSSVGGIPFQKELDPLPDVVCDLTGGLNCVAIDGSWTSDPMFCDPSVMICPGLCGINPSVVNNGRMKEVMTRVDSVDMRGFDVDCVPDLQDFCKGDDKVISSNIKNLRLSESVWCVDELVDNDGWDSTVSKYDSMSFEPCVWHCYGSGNLGSGLNVSKRVQMCVDPSILFCYGSGSDGNGMNEGSGSTASKLDHMKMDPCVLLCYEYGSMDCLSVVKDVCNNKGMEVVQDVTGNPVLDAFFLSEGDGSVVQVAEEVNVFNSFGILEKLDEEDVCRPVVVVHGMNTRQKVINLVMSPALKSVASVTKCSGFNVKRRRSCSVIKQDIWSTMNMGVSLSSVLSGKFNSLISYSHRDSLYCDQTRPVTEVHNQFGEPVSDSLHEDNGEKSPVCDMSFSLTRRGRRRRVIPSSGLVRRSKRIRSYTVSHHGKLPS